VIIADGGWQGGGRSLEIEEERRVFYVAATRAKETLTVMVRTDQRNPFPSEMTCESVVDRTPRNKTAGPASLVAKRRYVTLDPTQIFISYAGSMPANSPVHKAIQMTNAGDLVQLVRRGNSIRIETPTGVPIGQLSEAGRKIWETRLEHLQTAKVSAMVHRTKDQELEEHRERMVVDSWEYPVIELYWSPLV
jgi:ATP-dependent DNA helicase RecQ